MAGGSVGTALAAVIILTGAAPATQPAHPEAGNVVVIVNEAVAESVKLGEYYAARRGVPAENICKLKTSESETINRDGFTKEILEPVQKFLADRKFVTGEGFKRVNQARYLVTVYGVPVRISEKQNTGKGQARILTTDRAAVDSDLTLVLQKKFNKAARLRNPYFGQKVRFADCRLRLKRQRKTVPAPSVMCLVTRLDGPTPAIVRGMIDDAIRVEKTGLKGNAYFDIGGRYPIGDKWIAAGNDVMKKAGFTCDMETSKRLFPDSRPMTDACVYMGWYTGKAYGRFLNPAFRFAPGAIAYHLHSYSATVLRTEDDKWVGPLLARGAAVTMGHVYEPNLDGTPRPAVFLSRLLAGWNLAEAAYASLPFLSWQNVILGDPLYRPFAVRAAGRRDR